MKAQNRSDYLSRIIFSSALLFAVIYYGYGLWSEDLGNLYYTAAVKSMGMNLKNFLYNSFDPGAFVTVDKPPLGLWLQVISTKIFGINRLGIMFPQAFAGIASILLVYLMTKKYFGLMTASVSALLLSVTPVFVAAARNNTMDILLIAVLLWASLIFLESVRNRSLLKWILGSFLIGFGFLIKMMQAYLILPAVYLTYLIYSKERFFKKVQKGILSGIIVLTVSFSWIMFVDLTPEENRPFIGSSTDNSALELVFGHNGLSRFIKSKSGGGLNNSQKKRPQNNFQPSGMMNGNGQAQPPAGAPDGNCRPPLNPPQGNNRPAIFGGHGGGMDNETGDAGLFRLWNSQLYGQSGWFLIISIMSFLFWGLSRKLNIFRQTKENMLMFYGLIWMLPMGIYFSLNTGIFHRYYLAMISPFISVTAAWLIVRLPLMAAGNKKIKILLNALLMVSVGFSFVFFFGIAGSVPLVTGVYIIVLLTAFIFSTVMIWKNKSSRVFLSILFTVLILPLFWSATPLIYGDNPNLPYAGVSLKNDRMKNGMDALPDEWINYLTENQTTDYLVAVDSSHIAAPVILSTGKSVMAMGGFNGSDQFLTVDHLRSMILEGRVRYFVISQSGKQMPGFGGPGNEKVKDWIQQNGEVIKRQSSQTRLGMSETLLIRIEKENLK